ncbi:MAG: protein jag [Clostridia bacterium]|nr:protein jag [Clostridia bacterium]
MEEKNVYVGKTVEEATALGLEALGITEEEAEITVIDEGKKKLLGGSKAKVKVVKKLSDGNRAVEFLDGLTEILGLNVVCELVSDADKIEINLTTTESSRVIGRHGDVLDSLQTLAGAVANIGRDDYKKVVVDCENYRANREQTLTELAHRIAKKAVERQRRVTLEPMNPYERRIIHAALSDNPEVKTTSCGNEPSRYVVVIPENEKPYQERGGDRPYRGDRGGRPRSRERGGDRERRGDRQRSGGSRQGGAPRGKKEIHFGAFLGNSGNAGKDDE